jgi:hypothetical protein
LSVALVGGPLFRRLDIQAAAQAKASGVAQVVEQAERGNPLGRAKPRLLQEGVQGVGDRPDPVKLLALALGSAGISTALGPCPRQYRAQMVS